ncbi:helix-turn-helix transcriptional regulator [Microlunatus parietis]|uniref:Transcriptional regulator with XRE-family HTH domain n=1 Tax=Microlunatus parietis TaxID=682979 RepID=A0A7Y9LA52_9ACTN|nr:helix-turn-helix transcriptional regulator [Microlunatus parietis]NYE69418.1 transcriptional regulator with XRE-family HTH domain [Microlunatus parietis]
MSRSGAELGAFLRARRAGLQPGDLGLQSYGSRRVAGLRREEVALLAQVSTSYYTRIEQGTAGVISAAVLESLARTFELDDDERAHLFRLAKVAPAEPEPGPGGLDRDLDRLVKAIDPVPAAVLGPSMDILGWNRTCHLIFGSHLTFELPIREPERSNWIRLLFVDPEYRRLFVDWTEVATDVVGRLRTSSGRWPAHGGLRELITDLGERCPEFLELWHRHPVRDRPLSGVRLAHPVLGPLELSDVVLSPVGRDDLRLLIFLAEPGSPTARVLDRRRAS